jgi:adenylate cyclase
VAARRRPPEDLRAYDLYIQGYYLSDNWTSEAQARIEMLFEEARRIDPTFARAFTGLVYVHMNRTLDGGRWAPREPDEHRLAAVRARSQRPRVHHTLGFICLHLRQFARAERHLDLARAMNPNDPTIQIGDGSRGVQGSRSED